MALLKDLCVIWRTLVILVTPLAALPILLHDGSREMACLYGVVIMATLWITEALPIPITALCPVFVFSMLGVLPAKVVAASYVKDSLIFSVTCLSAAVCVEKWRLHRRIALNTLLLVGSSPKWLMLGFMLPTWFLSMLVNNTSATAMMLPVVSAVLVNLGEVNDAVKGLEMADNGSDESGLENRLEKQGDCEKSVSKTESEAFKNLCKAFTLCVCYSATIGGIASVTGTSTNLIMQGQAEEYFSQYDRDSGINFLSWLMCCLPISAICLLIAWTWLIVLFMGVRELFNCDCGGKAERAATKKVIRKFLNELGPLSFAEKAVIVHLAILFVLWLTIKVPGGGGWHTLFKDGYVKNSTPGILILASLFIFPSQRSSSSARSHGKPPALLDWKTVNDNFPWGTILLLGGGYAVANACQKSGLSEWLGLQLAYFSNIEPWQMVLALSFVISFITEITSNAATSSILCPILVQMAVSLNVNPLYVLFVGILACSFAFMLPVATPPNAIAFATGHLRIVDMVKAGFVLNLLCVGVVNMGINVWAKYIFDFDILPQELKAALDASSKNVSSTVFVVQLNVSTTEAAIMNL